MLLLLAGLILADWYGETIGLPARLERQVERQLATRGIRLRLENLRCGIVNGLVAEGVALEDAGIPGWPLFSAKRVQCDLDPDWQRLRLRLAGLNIGDGRLELMLFPEAGDEGWYDRLVLSGLELRLTRESGRKVRIEYLSGKTAGVLIKAAGELTLPAGNPAGTSSPGQVTAWSSRPFLTGLSQSFRSHLATVLQRLEQETNDSRPARCRLRLKLRLDDPPSSQAESWIELPRLAWGRMVATNVRGHLRFGSGNIEVKELTAQLADGAEHLRIVGSYQLAERRLDGVLTGHLSPATLAPLLEQEWGRVLTPLLAAATVPGELSATLDHCLPQSGRFRGTCAFSLPEITFGRFSCRMITGEIRIPEDLRTGIIISQLRSEFAAGGGMTLQGHYDRIRGVASGTIAGDLPGSLVATLPRAAEIMNATGLNLTGNVGFTGTLERLTLPDLQLAGRLTLSVDQFRIGPNECRNLAAEIRLPEDATRMIELASCRFALADGGELSLNGQLNMAQQTLSGRIAGRLPGAVVQGQPLVSAILGDQPLVLAGGEWNFSGNLRRLALSGDHRSLLADLTLNVSRLQYHQVEFTGLRGRLELDGTTIRGREWAVSTTSGNRLTGDFLWRRDAGLFAADFACDGAPQFLPQLLPEKESRYLEKLFAEITWPHHPQAVAIEGTATVNMTAGAPYFLLNADVTMQDFAWRQVPFRFGTARLQLDSAQLLLIPTMILEREEGRAVLSLALDQRREPAADPPAGWLPGASSEPRDCLELEFDSTLSGNAFLPLLMAEWKPGTAGLDLAEVLPIRGGGTLDYLDPARTMVRAHIERASGRWHSLPFAEVRSDLELGATTFALPALTGKLAGGELSFSCRLDHAAGVGQVSGSLREAAYGQVLAALDVKPEPNEPGIIMTELAATLHRNTATAPWRWDGRGSVSVRQANLWRIPMLADFSALLHRALGVKDWGKISSLDADFVFQGDRLRTTNLRTDGTVVALTAEGEYLLAPGGDYDFALRARLLRKALPINLLSRLLDPVGWLLETRVQRKDGKVTWEHASALRRLLLAPTEKLLP